MDCKLGPGRSAPLSTAGIRDYRIGGLDGPPKGNVVSAQVPLLEARGISKKFGSLQALYKVDLELHARLRC